MAANKDVNSSWSFYELTKDIVIRSGTETTAHGIPNICRAESWPLRLVWTVCLLTGGCYGIYCVIDIVEDYLSYPVVSNVEVIDERTTAFPTIMFCNLNPVNTDKPGVTDSVNDWTKSFGVNSSLSTTWYSFYMTEVVKSMMASIAMFNYNGTSRQLHTSLISCTFGLSPCSLADFEFAFVYDYVNCYKFNANGARMSSRRGSAYGLQLELYIGNSSSPDDALFYGSRGIRYIVTNSSLSNDLIFDQGYDAAPGFVTNVEVTKKYYDRLSSPYSDCQEDLTPQSPNQSPTMKIMFEEANQKQYSQTYCQNLCIQLEIIEECRCFAIRYPGTNSMILKTNKSYCLINDYVKCVMPKIQSLSTTGSNCQLECKSECEFIKYESTVTTSEYMSQWYWSHLKNYSSNYVAEDNTSYEIERQVFFNSFGQTKTLTEARQSTLKLNVFLGHIGYYSTSESPFYTFNSLLGSVGGQLGLFLGISLLSFMELFEMVYLIVELWFGRIMAGFYISKSITVREQEA